MRRYKYLPPVLIICAVLGFTIIRNMRTGADYYSDSAIMMDTVVEVSVWGKGKVPATAAVDSVLKAMARIDRLLGDGFVEVGKGGDVLRSNEFGHLLAVSRRAHDATRGLFDPTIGSVSRLWEFWEGAEPPREASIKSALAHVGLEAYLSGRDPGGTVFDLGGVAKGYAVDLGAETLRRLGFKSAIINAGGDLNLIGKRVDRRPWRIAIRHPRQSDGFIGYLDLEDVSVATSGDYERCFIYDGRRYHHILDPRTGMPGGASTGVTVVGPSSCLSDALATGLFLLGPVEGLAVVESLEGIDAVFVNAGGDSLAVSSGLASGFGRFEPE
ncbi:MAG: FAD:protein FMN transferase [Candidatus Eisenbacteria bacterium]